jgi:hypothetical protein
VASVSIGEPAVEYTEIPYAYAVGDSIRMVRHFHDQVFKMTIQELYGETGDKWCQHSTLNYRAQMCLEGALHECYPSRAERNEARHRLEQRIKKTGFIGSHVAWNDAAGRTVEQVLDLVAKAGV